MIEWWPYLGSSASVLAQAYPQARRTGLEPTPDLLERSQQQHQPTWWSFSRWSRIQPEYFLETDAIQVPLPVAAELVWANMTLHHSADPLQWLSRWSDLLGSGGLLMFSCFGPDTLKELRALYAQSGWGPIGTAFIDMHDLGDMLVESGFCDPVMDQETLTLTWPSASALIDEITHLGHNTAPDRFPGLRTQAWKLRLEEGLRSQTISDGRIKLTMEIVYGHAFKPITTRIALKPQTQVSLVKMRQILTSRGKTQG